MQYTTTTMTHLRWGREGGRHKTKDQKGVVPCTAKNNGDNPHRCFACMLPHAAAGQNDGCGRERATTCRKLQLGRRSRAYQSTPFGKLRAPPLVRRTRSAGPPEVVASIVGARGPDIAPRGGYCTRMRSLDWMWPPWPARWYRWSPRSAKSTPNQPNVSAT